MDIDRRKGKAYECDICDRNFHEQCLGLPLDAVKAIASAGHMLPCDSCSKGCKKMLRQLTRLEAKIDEHDTRIKKNEHRLDEHGEELNKLKNKASPKKEIFGELNERKRRENNVIVYGIPDKRGATEGKTRRELNGH